MPKLYDYSLSVTGPKLRRFTEFRNLDAITEEFGLYVGELEQPRRWWPTYSDRKLRQQNVLRAYRDARYGLQRDDRYRCVVGEHVFVLMRTPRES